MEQNNTTDNVRSQDIPGTVNYLDRVGFSPEMLAHIGAIAVLSGIAEFNIERTIWALNKENPEGTHPSTDAKPVGFLIDMVSKAQFPNQQFLELWVKLAKSAFKSRNTIFHGMSVGYGSDGSSISFINNARWAGEKRKRQPTTFSADTHTLKLLRGVFETLFKGVIRIKRIADGGLEQEMPKDVMTETRRALSIAYEIEDLPAAVNHEKY